MAAKVTAALANTQPAVLNPLSLVVVAPWVSGTDAAVPANNVYGDMQNMFAGDFFGKGLRLGLNGSALTPAFAFANDNTSGLYLVGVGQPAISANGAVALSFGTTQKATFAADVIAPTLALGGATIGTDKLAITGTASISGGIATGGVASSSTGTGIAAYNTSDQTTNYERFRLYFSGNIANLEVEKGGTGTARALVIKTSSGSLTLNDGNSTVVITSGDFRVGNRKVSGVTRIEPNANGTSAFAIFDATGTNNILNVDSTNKRIGINAATPAALLEVAGTTSASVSAALLSAAILTGATATTNFPHWFIQPTGATAVTTWSTAGTGLGMNLASAFAGNFLDFHVNGGSSVFKVDNTGAVTSANSITSTATITIVNSASGLALRNGTTLLTSPATASFQLGNSDAASPVAQTLGVQNVVAGTSNTAGADWTLKASSGTGTGAGGKIIFQVAPAGSTGTGQNAFSNLLTLSQDYLVAQTGNPYSSGTSASWWRRVGNNASSTVTVQEGSGTSVSNIYYQLSPFGVQLPAGSYYSFGSISTGGTSSADLFLTRAAAAILQHGAADAASPVAQTIGVQNVVAGTSNTAGVDFTIKGSAGTGTGVPGKINIQFAPAGVSGTSQNAFSTFFVLQNSGANALMAAPAVLLLGGNTIAQLGLSTNGIITRSTYTIGWSSDGNAANTPDTGLSRDSAGVIDVGNGTAGNKSGSINLTNLTATGNLTGVGGSISALTSFGVRSTGAAFDLKFASSEVLTATRTLSIVMGDANRTLTVTDLASLSATSQTFSGGLHITSYSIGTVSSGTTTIDCGNGPQQYLTNNGAFTLAAPASDGNCILMVTNGASAGAITFSGFTVGSVTGDALTTTNTSKFLVSIMRINGVSTYMVKALQ